jgi:cytochrome P450
VNTRTRCDRRRWGRPDEYDITRSTAGHVAFGSGIHMCVGQLLARLEGEALLASLARQAATITLAGAPVRRPNNILRALRSLPLRLRS